MLQCCPQVKEEAEATAVLAEMYRRGGFVFSICCSDESVRAYCARKMEAMSSGRMEF